MIVDIHSHLLPGVDDGAQTLEDSIGLAKEAVKQGVSHQILTPHHRNGRYNNYAKNVRTATQALQSIYDQEGIPLTLHASQEIRITSHLLDDLYAEHLLSLDDQGNYYLCEFPTQQASQEEIAILENLLDMGLTPVIAHPERNLAFQADFSLLADLINQGCLSQVTTSCIAGIYGKELYQYAYDMIDQGLVHVLASDAHHLDWRSFHYQKAFTQLEKDFGREKVVQFQQNAEAILSGDVVQRDSVHLKKGKNFLKRLTKWF